jgi:hypothetical protein
MNRKFQRWTRFAAAATVIMLGSATANAQWGIPSIPGGLGGIRPQFNTSRGHGGGHPVSGQATYHPPVTHSLSQATTTPAKSEPVVSDSQQRRFALIVCSETYLDSNVFPPLSGIGEDAERLKATLRYGGFPEENITVLSSRNNTVNQNATRSSILATLKTQLGRPGEDDIFVMFVLGHGISLNGTSYYCPQDATAASRTDSGAAERELLSIKELASTMASAKVVNKALVVDACREIGSTAGRGFVRPQRDTENRVWIMNSCRDGEFAWLNDSLKPGESHAIFSFYLAEGLSGVADLSRGDNNGRVSVFEAFKYAQKKTRDAATAMGCRQTPILMTGNAPFDLVAMPTALPESILKSGDEQLTSKQSAKNSAGIAKSSIRDQVEHLEKKVAGIAEIPVEVFDDEHKQLCYIMGNFLTPALAMDQNCTDAHLCKGIIFRECADYVNAVREFQLGEQPMEVFAAGDVSRAEGLFEVQENGDRVVKANLTQAEMIKLIPPVDLLAEPGDYANVVGNVQTTNSLLVRDAVLRQADNGVEEQWLLVSEVDDVKLKNPGWIHESQVHWTRQATRLYADTTDEKDSRGLPQMMSNGVAARETVQHIPQQVVMTPQHHGGGGRLQGTQQGLARAQIGLGIAARFGAPVGRAQAVIGRVQGGIAMAQTIVATVRSVRASAHSTSYGRYVLEDIPRSQQINARRLKLQRLKHLDPVVDRPVKIASSPWRLTDKEARSIAAAE